MPREGLAAVPGAHEAGDSEVLREGEEEGAVRGVTGVLEVMAKGDKQCVVLLGRPDQCVVPMWALVVGVLGEEVTLGLPDATVEDECPTTTDP